MSPRRKGMTNKRFESKTCTCQKLGGMAHLNLEYLKHPTGFEALADFDCEDTKKCGVGRKTSSFEWTFDFIRGCPIYQEMTKK